MTEWGSLSLVDEGQGDAAGKSLSLPGVTKGDLSSRHWKPEVRVSGLQFSPTGKLAGHVLLLHLSHERSRTGQLRGQ